MQETSVCESEEKHMKITEKTKDGRDKFGFWFIKFNAVVQRVLDENYHSIDCA